MAGLDPLGQAGRFSSLVVAESVGFVDRQRWATELVAGRRVHRGHVSHALGWLCRERCGRSRLRPRRAPHRAASGHLGQGVQPRGAAGRRGARTRRFRPGAHHQPAHHPDVGRGVADRDRLSLHQALAGAAAGLSRRGLQLWHSHGLCRSARRGAATGLGAAAGQSVLGAGLRHRIRHGRPRRRSQGRHQDLGHHLRPRRRGSGHGELLRLHRPMGCRGVGAATELALLPGCGRRRSAGQVSLHPHPRARSGAMLSRLPAQPLSGFGDVCWGRARLYQLRCGFCDWHATALCLGVFVCHSVSALFNDGRAPASGPAR